MNANEPDLDTFEQALLLQLRTRAQRAGLDNELAATAAVPRRSRRAWYSSAAAAVAAILGLALLLHVVRPEPAFAVTGRNGSKITVKVARLEGADRLEQALADRGVNSDITYLPPGKSCAENRYVERRTPGLGLVVGANRFDVTIPPGAVGNGDTFVLSASVTVQPNGIQTSVSYGIATGTVSPCRVIDTP